MAVPSVNIVTSKVAIQERFIQLYRKLFFFFLKKDIVHRTDYLEDLMLMNARVTELQSKTNALFQLLQSHIHGNGSNGSPTTVPLNFTHTPIITNLVQHKDVALETRANTLYGMGPAAAPLSDDKSAIATATSLEQKTTQESIRAV